MRRLGSVPAGRGSTGYNNCPDVIELDDGDLTVIGYWVRRSRSRRRRSGGVSVLVDEAAEDSGARRSAVAEVVGRGGVSLSVG